MGAVSENTAEGISDPQPLRCAQTHSGAETGCTLLYCLYNLTSLLDFYLFTISQYFLKKKYWDIVRLFFALCQFQSHLFLNWRYIPCTMCNIKWIPPHLLTPVKMELQDIHVLI